MHLGPPVFLSSVGDTGQVRHVSKWEKQKVEAETLARLLLIRLGCRGVCPCQELAVDLVSPEAPLASPT